MWWPRKLAKGDWHLPKTCSITVDVTYYDTKVNDKQYNITDAKDTYTMQIDPNHIKCDFDTWVAKKNNDKVVWGLAAIGALDEEHNWSLVDDVHEWCNTNHCSLLATWPVSRDLAADVHVPSVAPPASDAVAH